MSDVAVEQREGRWDVRSRLPVFALAVLLVATVQSGALAWMIYDRVTLITSGKEVVLDTVPVDPRSLFRGDYVILNYKISRLNAHDLEGDDYFESGDIVYVALRKTGETSWTPVSVAKKPPSAVGQGQVILRGKVWFASDSAPVTRPPPRTSGSGQDRLGGPVRVSRDGGSYPHIKYGIEAYFVPEGEGKRLEDLVRESKLQVLIAVGEDGKAAIKGLLIDGALQYEEPLF